MVENCWFHQQVWGACLKAPDGLDDLARSGAFNTITGLITSATGLAGAVLIARAFGAEGAGVVAYVVWLAYMAATVADPGVSASLVRYIPELRARGQQALASSAAAALFRIVAVALSAGVLGLAALSYVVEQGAAAGSAIGARNWALAGALMVALGLATTFTSYLKGMQQFDRIAALALKSSLLQLSVLLVGLPLLGIPGALLAYIAASILPAVLSLQLVRRRSPIPHELKMRMLRFAPLSWAIMIVAGPVWHRAELFFLQRYWGMESVGLFSVGIALSGIATLLPSLMMGGVLPHFGGLIGRDAISEMKSTYWQATRLISLVVFPACFGMAAVTPALVPLLYGGQFETAIPAVMIVAAGSAIVFAAGVNANVLLSFERGKLLLASNIVGFAIMVAAGLLVIPAYGIVGAALSRTAVQTAVVGIELWLVVRMFGFAFPAADVAKTAAAAFLCAVTAYLCIKFIGGAVSLIVAVPAGVVVYLAAIRELAVLHPSDKRILEWVTARAPTPFRAPILFGIRIMVRG